MARNLAAYKVIQSSIGVRQLRQTFYRNKGEGCANYASKVTQSKILVKIFAKKFYRNKGEGVAMTPIAPHTPKILY